MGWANFNLGDIGQSQKFADNALEWINEKNLPQLQVDALILKGISASYLKEFDVAETSLNKALDIRQKLGDNDDIAEIYYNLGFMEIENNNFKKALSYFLQSYSMLKESKNDIYLSWCLSGLGRTYLKLGDLSNAEKYLSLAQSKARGMSLKELVLILYLAQQELFEANHNSVEALHFSKLAYALQDSLHRSDVAKRFAALQHSDQITILDKNIQSLKQEKDFAAERILFQTRVIIAFIGLVLVIGIVAMLYARLYRRSKRLHEAVNIQKEALENQTNYINQLNRNLEGMVAEKTADLQHTNQELIKQNNDLLQFSYTVSHNLRGPVARLLGITNIIQYSKSVDDQNQMIDYIRKASKDLDNTLGDLSKIIDIKNDLYQNNEWVSLKEEWQRSQSLLSDVIKDDFQISAAFEEPDKIFTIRAFIQSLFYNLTSNAIKYRSVARKLELAASSRIENGMVVIEVKDNGVGIDIDKHKDSVFKLFKRFHTHVEGRGLGLYLIKSQVEALNGTIDVYSKIDEGTLFRVILPNVVK
jgi:signal transduction histidine kinase